MSNNETSDSEMPDNENNHSSALDRRTLLRAGLAAAFAGPVGAIGAQAFTPRAIGPAIELVGVRLSAFRNAYPHQLSGGMAQRWHAPWSTIPGSSCSTSRLASSIR